MAEGAGSERDFAPVDAEPAAAAKHFAHDILVLVAYLLRVVG
jgi:hypothetical protein